MLKIVRPTIDSASTGKGTYAVAVGGTYPCFKSSSHNSKMSSRGIRGSIQFDIIKGVNALLVVGRKRSNNNS